MAIDALGKKAATVFGPELGKAQQWAAQNAEAMGLTRSQAVGLAAGFSDLLIPMGFTRQQATKMSTDVVGLSGALSEWSGGQKTAAEVSDILAKAMLGERDGLKALGVSISDADVKARLAAKGQDKLTGAALEQAKALVTQQLIMEKSTDAQAAYAAGADNPIRKQAQLRARALELKEAFATALLPASNAVIGGLLEMSEGALPKVEAKLAAATVGVQGFVAGLQGKGSVDGFTGRLNYLGLGLRALVEAFRDGDVTSNGFVGKMERVGVAARSAWDQLAVVKAGVGEFAAGLTMSTAAASAAVGSMDGLSGAGARVRLALVQAKDAVMGMFPTNATGGIDFAATLDRVEAGARKLWPQVKEVGASLAGLGPVVTVTGAVFGFFADHIDTVIQYMPLLIAGFIAWKTAQALSLAVQIAHLPVTIALAASNIAYASAVYALLAAMGIERTSRIASIAAWAVHLVQIVAHNVALLALRAGILITSGAVYAITAAQWAWNVAMSANPVGAVIIILALLVAGLVLAWRESDTFRKVVTDAWRVVQAGVGAAWAFIRDEVFAPLGSFLMNTIPSWFATLRVVVSAVWGAFRDTIAGGWYFIRDNIFGPLGFFVGTTIPGIFSAGVGMIGGIWDSLKDKLRTPIRVAFDFVNTKVIGPLQGILDKLPGNIRLPLLPAFAAGGAVRGPGTGTSDGILARLSDDEHVWTAAEVKAAGGHRAVERMRKTALQVSGDGSDGVYGAAMSQSRYDKLLADREISFFGGGGPLSVSTAAALWRGVADIDVKSGTGGRNPVEAFWGPLKNFLGLYSDGGRFQDVYVSSIADHGPAGPNATLAHEMGHAMSLAHASKGSSLMYPYLNGQRGPTSGDRDALKRAFPDRGDQKGGGLVANVVKQVASSLTGFAANAVLGPLRSAALSFLPDDVFPLNMARGAMDSVFDAILGLVGSNQGGGSTPNGDRGLGPAALKAAAAVREIFGFTGTIGGYANRNIAGTNTPSKHSLGKAIDVMTYGNTGLGQRVADYFVSNRGTYGVDNVIWNRQITNAGRGWQFGPYRGANPHTDHPHIDFFDQGGVARGSGMMPKYNPRPERVLSPRQTEAFERLVDVIDERAMGGSAVMGGVTYSGTVNVVDPEEFARRTVARQRDAAAVAGLSSIL